DCPHVCSSPNPRTEGSKYRKIEHRAINVPELERSIAWYVGFRGRERRFQDEWGDVPTMMCAGETCVALFVSERSGERPIGPHQTPSLHHVAFRVDRQNFEAARRHFRDLAIEFRAADHGIAQSIYIADPDGHRIEITTYDV